MRFSPNLVPRACDPREGNEGSGIIRFREDSDWPLKWMRSSILATIPGFRQRIIPEPSFPSQGSQARGTRLGFRHIVYSKILTLYQPRSQALSSCEAKTLVGAGHVNPQILGVN